MKNEEDKFSRKIGANAARKLKAQRRASRNIWFGFGTFGVIGWSVALPAVFGALLGLWLDKHYPSGRSWTLMLLLAGLVAGCFTAWHWVARQDKEIRNEAEDKDE
jgi:ATP synthase protein I